MVQNSHLNPIRVSAIFGYRKLQKIDGSVQHFIAWNLVNYNELTTSSLEIIVSKGNHPQMALIQVSELL